MSDTLLTDDTPLIANDIGQLENADQIVHFFAHLGYDVDDSLALDHSALGLDTADLRQQIRAIRRVGADPVDGDVVVYLCEVRSVTVALTQQIARRFRERPENALLVLTTDYENLDFVLVDRELAQGRRMGSALRQIIRPRTLTVNRRNPGPVELRVLRRFRFTEADGGYQWEKLRSAFTLAEWSEQYFNNRALFSDYYLTTRLTDPTLTPAWSEDVGQIGRAVLRLLADARQQFSGKGEAVVRAALYAPLFTSLGFRAVAQPAADDAPEQPDYLLYAPGDSPNDPATPIAAALTTVWNRNLDDSDESRDTETPNEIPGARVVSVLAATPAKWVIVTNGKLWRLYSATASNKATNYYEIDLDEAVHAPDQRTALKYWWLFFRRAAFQGFLDDLLQKSADYAAELGERLKGRVFTEIFPHFAAGFIAHQRRSRTFDKSSTSDFSPAQLDRLFTATMTFLYRLMFILYAESLELLPVYESRGYGEASLDRLKKEIAKAAGDVEDGVPARLAGVYGDDATGLYTRLQTLFTAIDAGATALNLPKYNGGLFSSSSDDGRFLSSHAIPDRFLALGLDRLCRDVDAKSLALAAIDYKSLGVRQLGSIYEGLLEFRVRLASEPLAVVKEKGKEVYLPAAELGNRRAVATLAVGDVYLENDKRERKATGSYYTPDYIVKYIVEHTVGPVLERKFAALEERLRQAQKLYRQHKATVQARGNDQSPELFWKRPEMQRLADDCLDVRVLDPAMGSGHFLVEAVDFVSDRLIKFLNGWTENPVWALLERTRQEIVADMERQGVSIDNERLTRVALLKRSVLKRCIYGVDLNGMAVELAKVSLWLDAFTLGAPLSFLDHHLKWGNSLIGARVQEVKAALESRADQQLGLFAQSKFVGVMLATDLMRQVSYQSDNTVEQLEASASAYRSAADHLAPYKRVLDVYTSRWFGNEPSKKGTDDALEFLQRADVEAWLKNPDKAQLPAADYMDTPRIGGTALSAAAEKRFFHWELEFPEVFFAPSQPGGQDVQLRADGGFDAVVGNPPYQVMENMDSDQRSYFYGVRTDGARVYSSAESKANIYSIFWEQSLLSLARDSYFGMITPYSWVSNSSFRELRKYLFSSSTPRFLSAFPVGIFEDVGIATGIFIFENHLPTSVEETILYDARDDSLETIEATLTKNAGGKIYSVPVRALIGEDSILYLSYVPGSDAIRKHFQNLTSSLIEICEIAYGCKTADTQTFIGIDFRIEQNSKRLLQGEDIQRHTYEWGNKYLYYQPERMLLLHETARPGDQDRFEIAEKLIVYRFLDTQHRFVSTYDDHQFYCLDSTYVVVSKLGTSESLLYIQALLSSGLLGFYNRLFAGVKVTQTEIERIPIRRIKFVLSPTLRSQLASTAHALYQRILTDGSAPLLAFVAEQLAAQPERSDVVHDLLAFLAERMIEGNKAKQAEVKRFLGWLEGKLRIQPKKGAGGIDSLTGKTIIQGYLGDYQKGKRETAWADFLYRLHQNRNRFGVQLDGVQGEIQTEYESSLALLLPIKSQLAHTDNLIDQIVYKLYGLTDAEIELIERPAYDQALADAKAKIVGDETLQADPDAAAGVMAEIVLPAAQRLQQQIPHSAERAALDVSLPGWHLFPAEVATFLLSGEYDIHTRPDGLDFSSAVVSFAKAVERMLYHRLFIPWRDEAGALEGDARNSFLQAFLRREKELTLGSLAIILQSSKETALRAYIQQRYPHAADAFFGPGGVVAGLTDQASVDLRNAAAHDELLGRDAATSARSWALGILRHL